MSEPANFGHPIIATAPEINFFALIAGVVNSDASEKGYVNALHPFLLPLV